MKRQGAEDGMHSINTGMWHSLHVQQSPRITALGGGGCEAGLRPGPGNIEYVVSCHVLLGFTEMLAVEWDGP